jgi:hypothetical protein
VETERGRDFREEVPVTTMTISGGRAYELDPRRVERALEGERLVRAA